MSDHMKEAERLLNEVAHLAEMNAVGLASSAQLAEARSALLAHIQRGAVPAPAGVPMPEDDIMRDALEHLAGLDTHDVNLRDNPKAYEVLERLVRTYGAACRAAGEAAGYARGLRDAGHLPNPLGPANGWPQVSIITSGTTTAPDEKTIVALRGEAKP